MSISVQVGDPFEAESFVMGTYKRWSSSAVECYLREGKCEGCYYQKFFSAQNYGCKMSQAVEQLLETLGEPTPSTLNRCS